MYILFLKQFNIKVTPHNNMYKVSPRATDQMKKIPKDNGGSDEELAVAANDNFY